MYFRISVLTLASSHPIIQDKKTVTKVDFQVNKDTNRLENKVTGKGKRVKRISFIYWYCNFLQICLL